MKNKVNGFTLSEMLVVIVVASIVISSGFLVLQMVRKQVRLIQQNYEIKQELSVFEATLSRDFNTRKARFDQKSNALMLSNSKDSIQYLFLEHQIVREKDTFTIAIAEKKIFLDGLEVQEGRIDAIEFQLPEQFFKKQFFIQQIKDGSYYVNK